MLCQFSWLIVVFVPEGPNTCLVIVSCVYDNIKFGFYLFEWDLNSTREWLVIPMTYMPLLTNCGHVFPGWTFQELTR